VRGTRLKGVLDTAGTDRDLQDLDVVAALSDFSKQQTIIEAAQKSFVQTTSLSLFNYMN
jgi:flagellar hook-associated protein 3 FlgL